MNRCNMTVAELTLTLTNTEYSYALPANTVAWCIRCRTSGLAVRMSNVSGKVAGSTSPYFTIPADTPLNSPNNWSNSAGALTLYFAATSGAAPVMEILSYQQVA